MMKSNHYYSYTLFIIITDKITEISISFYQETVSTLPPASFIITCNTTSNVSTVKFIWKIPHILRDSNITRTMKQIEGRHYLFELHVTLLNFSIFSQMDLKISCNIGTRDMKVFNVKGKLFYIMFYMANDND